MEPEEKTAWILRPTPPGYRTSGGVGWLAGARFPKLLAMHPAKNLQHRKIHVVRNGQNLIICQKNDFVLAPSKLLILFG
jgi:hypothetical protein